MFVPQGKIIHESLATSYVLVDSLVSDLCEGGFSGIVEIVLRNTDSYIVISSGNVAGVVQLGGGPSLNGNSATQTLTSVAQLAERSRLERGRLSIHAYSTATAAAVAGRITAQVLYAGLSTEFTDLEKMIWKLSRERQREWFIEVNNPGGLAALIHMRDNVCRVLRSTDGDPKEQSFALDQPGNREFRKALDECSSDAGTFDVYFKTTAEVIEPSIQTTSSPVIEAPAAASDAVVLAQAVSDHAVLWRDEPVVEAHVAPHTPDAEIEIDDALSLLDEFGAISSAVGTTSTDAAALDGDDDLIVPPETNDSESHDLPFETERLGVSSDDEVMAEVKRLMSEIAKTIEQAAQAVGRPDRFSMSLRAGQLKIADRYPFLDPFAGEFEYLAGEIVFVGRTTAEAFTMGLTEALKLAVQGVAHSSAYADRFRAYVTEDLRNLLARSRPEFEGYGLDQVIEEILTGC